MIIYRQNGNSFEGLWQWASFMLQAGPSSWAGVCLPQEGSHLSDHVITEQHAGAACSDLSLCKNRL